ncbi:Fic family protein [Intestinibacter bartlettii]|uniref:Fic family protein n=1 Tax=Intestinibacter bartlettii TaxID=261299 RepID=UPI00248A9502|nr:Fic family protein [Intestinibacter bartlettii]
MKITYRKLFEILKEKEISKTQLKDILDLSSATLAKLSKNQPISMNTLVAICEYLKCQPSDVMEIVEDQDQETLLYKLREEKNIKLKGSIYHQTQIKLTYNSNHMEGNMLSEEQTRYIYETNTIAVEKIPINIDDIIETVNHFQCFDYILDYADEVLTEKIIKEIHKILKTNTSDSRLSWFNVGEYKSKPNMVGDLQTISPNQVSAEIKKLLTWYNKKTDINVNDIIEFHYKFEQIHPFQDGNGRVGRLIIFKECLKHNIVPFIIDETHKFYYYRGLREFENEPGYLTDTCLSAQDNYKALLKYFGYEYN